MLALLLLYGIFMSFPLFSVQAESLPTKLLYGVSPSVKDMQVLLSDATYEDMRLLLNLLYWSYRRSDVTLRTQAAAENNLREQWDAWQRCATRRLNPKNSFLKDVAHEHHAQFINLEHEFHYVQSCYAKVVDAAVDKGNYRNQSIAKFVEDIREMARFQVMQAVKYQLVVVIQDLEQHLDVQSLGLGFKKRGIISYLTHQFAMLSFSQVDASWRTNSNKLMQQFLTIQSSFTNVWHTIETTRKAFYESYFKVAHEALVKLKAPAHVFTNNVIISSEQTLDECILSLSFAV